MFIYIHIDFKTQLHITQRTGRGFYKLDIRRAEDEFLADGSS